MNIKRLHQVVKYGWLHAGQIISLEGKGFLFRLGIFFDIIHCFQNYRMWSNQYFQERFDLLSKDDRHRIGLRYREEGLKRDEWQNDFIATRKFIIKYSNIRYELNRLREKRNKAYTSYYHAGKGLMVEHNVNLSRQHYLDGQISIGNNVLLAKNVFIDYSGGVQIKDGVGIANGVIIETHHHPSHSDYRLNSKLVVTSPLVIEEGVVIGSRAIILSSCNYIGKYARIGAGAVVTKNVPDYAVVAGVPAKVIKILADE